MKQCGCSGGHQKLRGRGSGKLMFNSCRILLWEDEKVPEGSGDDHSTR